jgi:hypothetical protein
MHEGLHGFSGTKTIGSKQGEHTKMDQYNAQA